MLAEPNEADPAASCGIFIAAQAVASGRLLYKRCRLRRLPKGVIPAAELRSIHPSVIMNKFFVFFILLVLGAAAYVGFGLLTKGRALPFDNGNKGQEITLPSPAKEGVEPASTQSDPAIRELTELEGRFETLAKTFDPAAPFRMQRIWKEGDNFYIEYHNFRDELHQFLVQKTQGTYKAQALFGPSESGWSLVKGEGNYVDPSALLYEKNEGGEWIKRN